MRAIGHSTIGWALKPGTGPVMVRNLAACSRMIRRGAACGERNEKTQDAIHSNSLVVNSTFTCENSGDKMARCQQNFCVQRWIVGFASVRVENRTQLFPRIVKVTIYPPCSKNLST